MGILLRDLIDGVVVPFSTEQLASNSILSVAASLSLFADILAIYALIKQGNIPHDTYYIISLTFADLGFALQAAIISVINGKSVLPIALIETYQYIGSNSGWAIGNIGKGFVRIH